MIDVNEYKVTYGITLNSFLLNCHGALACLLENLFA